jgi:signal transduction histidine kinase
VAALLISRWIARPYRLLAQAVVGAPEGVGPPAAEADDPDALVTIFRRVMEKIRTQEEELRRLAATEGEDPVGRFASTIAPTMVSGVIAVDRKGLVVALNPAAERMLGTPERSGEGGEARTGRAYAQVLACSEELVRIIGESLASGKPRSREVVSYRTSRGEPGHLGVALSPIAAEGAWPGGLLCLISDLSEIGSLQDKTRLRENLAAVGRLSAGIAHEFRNSLATIHGYARLVERLGEGGPTSGHARAIVREVDSVRAAVDEFLAFTRPAKITRTRVDLSSLCRQVAEEMALDGGLRPLEVTFEGTLPVVVGDETLLRQAFANIFRNAAESAPGRAVRLRVRGEMGPRSEAVRVELADDGAGIRQEDLERVFLPFYTTKEKGSGLGLAMAQKTILDHDGSVEVRSKLGEGTTFTVVLPIGVDAPA